MKLQHFLILLVLLSLLFACNKERIVLPPTDLQLEYYPLEIGRSWTYIVDSIVYDPIVGGIEQDSVRLFVKEIVVDTLRDNTNQLLYRVERFERYSDTLPWNIALVVAIGIENQKSAIRIEHNLRFSKFTFPPLVGKRWEGNSSFDTYRSFSVAGEQVQIFKGWNFFHQSTDEPWETDYYSFDSTATVIATNFISSGSLEFRHVEEKYAKHIGLVFREWIILDEDCNGTPENPCSDAPWREKAEKGFVIRQTLIDYE